MLLSGETEYITWVFVVSWPEAQDLSSSVHRESIFYGLL